MRVRIFAASALLALCGAILNHDQANAKSYPSEAELSNGTPQYIAQTEEGFVEGYISTPSDVTSGRQVCAQSVSNFYSMSCIYASGSMQGGNPPFKMSLPPGDYFIFGYEPTDDGAIWRYHSIHPNIYRGNGQPAIVRVQSGKTVSGVHPGHFRTCNNFPQVCIVPPALNADNTASPNNASNNQQEEATLRQQSQALFSQAIEAYENNNYVEAVDKFSESISLMSQDPEGAVILSDIINNTPIAGDLKGLFEAVIGRDSLTGASLAWWERVITAAPFDRQIATLWNAAKSKIRGTPDVISPTVTSGNGLPQRSINSPINPALPDSVNRSELSNNALTARVPKTTRVPAESVNATAERYGSSYPPFVPGTQVNVHEVKETATFVRFYGDESGAVGNFMMRLEDVEGLSPAQIRNQFALPPGNSMENMAVIKVRPGATLNSGPANAHPDWGSGGGNQYYLNGRFDESTVESVVEVQSW